MPRWLSLPPCPSDTRTPRPRSSSTRRSNGRAPATTPTSSTRRPRRSRRSRSTGPRSTTPSGPRPWPSSATPSTRPATTSRSARSSSPAPAARPSARAATSGSAATTATSATTRSPQQGVGRLDVGDLHVQIRRTPKPVIAMVAGYAVGGGHILHLVCDLTIAADNAPVRPDRAAGRQLRRRLRLEPARPQRRRQEGEGDLVPLPSLRRRGGARDGPRQHRGAARRPREARPSPGAAR